MSLEHQFVLISSVVFTVIFCVVGLYQLIKARRIVSKGIKTNDIERLLKPAITKFNYKDKELNHIEYFLQQLGTSFIGLMIVAILLICVLIDCLL